MFAPLTLLPRRKLAIALAAALLVTVPASIQPAFATNSVERDANRQSKDRWSRTNPSGPAKSSTEDEDSDTHHHHSDSLPAGHEGELNGHLHMHGW